MTQSGTTNPEASGPGCNGNEGVLYIPQISDDGAFNVILRTPV